MSRKERSAYITKKQKEYRRKELERNELSKKRWSLGYVKLDKPVRHGYEKAFVLSQQALNSNVKHRFEKLLDIFNNQVWCYSRDFLYSKRDYLYFSEHKIGDVKVLYPKKIDVKHMSIVLDTYLDRFPQDIRKYLTLIKQADHYGRQKYSVTIKPDIVKLYFKEQIRPHYITHRRILDPELESRITILDDWLYENRKWCSKSSKYDKWMDESRDQKIDAMYKEIIDEGIDDYLNEVRR